MNFMDVFEKLWSKFGFLVYLYVGLGAVFTIVVAIITIMIIVNVMKGFKKF